MAERPVYYCNVLESKEIVVVEGMITFNWHFGLELKDKQKNIDELHKNAKKLNPYFNILEVSTKSKNRLGKQLSAFNLTITDKRNKSVFTVESAFQSSKVFENGGPYTDIMEKNSIYAKRDPRLRNSGQLKKFIFYGNTFELEPKTSFYDWIYIKALLQHPDLAKEVLNYTAFTDIEFNPKKQINSQAHACALYISLYTSGKLDFAMKSISNYKKTIANQVCLI